MRSVAPMRTAKIGYIVMSAALFVLGIVLIVFPGFSASMLGIICGVMMILFGVIRLVGYFSKDLYRLAFQYDLSLGIIMIIIGIVMLVHPGSLVNFICVALGLAFMSDGLFKIQIAIDSKSFGIREWWMILIFAVAACVCGGILIFRPSESADLLTVMIGITMLSEGILNFSTVIAAVKIIKHQQPDVIEADYKEI